MFHKTGAPAQTDERSRSSTKHAALQRGPMWQCRQIEVLLATILNLSAYSSLLQEMGGTVCDGVCIRPAWHPPVQRSSPGRYK